jgi:hypothetical protein
VTVISIGFTPRLMASELPLLEEILAVLSATVPVRVILLSEAVVITLYSVVPAEKTGMRSPRLVVKLLRLALELRPDVSTGGQLRKKMAAKRMVSFS